MHVNPSRRELMLALAASSTAIARPADQHYVIRSFADLVVIDVAVEDRHGQAVAGLTREAFRILEDGHERPVTHFAKSEEPVAAGLVLDMSRSMAGRIPSLRHAVDAFLDASNSLNEYFIVTFNDSVRFLMPECQPFCAGPRRAMHALESLRADGRTSMNDGLAGALEHLRKSKLERRVILLVSDGKDNSSQTSSRQLIESLRASQATVHTLGLFDYNDGQDSNEGALRHIASISGGLYVHPSTPLEIEHACVRIARDIRARYTLGYPPAQAKSGGDRSRVRRVKVAVKAASVAKVRNRNEIVMAPQVQGS